jgi:hypothetical protein
MSPGLSAAVGLGLTNVLSWSAQLALLSLAAALLARLCPIERPAARLALWQALLLGCLALPVLQPAVPSGNVHWMFQYAPLDQVAGWSSAVTGPRGRAVPTWSAIAAGLLAGGAAVQLGRLGASLLRLRTVRRKASSFDAPGCLDDLRRALAPRAGFLVSDAGPATFGFLRPTILLPSALQGMPIDQQRAVVLHELLHARRGDWLQLLLEETIRAVLFLHPAVHWLVTRVRLAREQCVDAEVVRRLGERASYLESLIAVGRLTAGVRAVPAAPFLREAHLRERVDLLLKEVIMSRRRHLAHLLLTAATLLATGAWAVSAFPIAAGQSEKDSSKPSQPQPPPKVTSEPKVLHKVDAVYPPAAKNEGVEGTFRIDVLIDTGGRIKEARVVASAPTLERLKEMESQKGTPPALEGDARLAAAAVDAVKQWRYEPIRDASGKPIEARMTLTVRFVL